jgi:CSLREA domain-containing protein
MVSPRLARSAVFGTLLLACSDAQGVPPTFTVDSTSDVADANTSDGICDTGGGVCTLRAAIMQASATPGGGATVRVPNLGAPYLLSLGALTANASMTISGAGAATTAVDGGGASRILVVNPGATASVSGLTFQHGHGNAQQGGAIYDYGVLTLTRCVVKDSSDTTGGAGGGIAIDGGGSATLVETTVSGGTAALGGGIYNKGTLALVRSTVTGNNASSGGGMFMTNTATTTITNSTISENNALNDGGGILGQNSGTLHVFSSTITGNQADSNLDGSGIGGGVYVSSPGTWTFQNTILADNYESILLLGTYAQTPGDCAGTIDVSAGNVIIANYDTSHCTVTGSFILAEPYLGLLQMNGGPTKTHALLNGSPAINTGNPSGCNDALGAALHVDQRGAFRPKGSGSSACDIGAYEKNANGDVNGDGARNVSDVFYLINFLFAGGAAPTGLGDVNGDTKTDVSDVFYLINFLFAGGAAPL